MTKPTDRQPTGMGQAESPVQKQVGGGKSATDCPTTPCLSAIRTHTDRYLSVTVIEFLVLACLVVVAVHTPLSMIGRITGLTFRSYLVVSPLLSLAGVGCVAIHLRSRLRIVDRRDTGILVFALALGLVGAVLALTTLRPDTDDYFYVPNAVHFLNRLDEPMDLNIHFFIRSVDDPIVSVSQGTSTAYDYCRASIAFFLNADYLSVYYIVSVGLMGFLIPLAYFLLASRLTSDSRDALVGTVISVCALLIMTEAHRTFGNFAFPRIFHGKAVFLSVVLPAFTAFTISYFAQSTGPRWWCLFATATAGVGMSPSAAVLLPAHALILAAAYMATNYRQWKADIVRICGRAFKYLGTVAYSVLYAGTLYYLIRVRGFGSDPFALGGVPGGVDDSISLLFNRDILVTPVIVAVASALTLVLVRDWRRTFLAFWAVILAVLVLNPIAESLWTGTFVPANMYWRLYYLYPFPAAAALVGAVVFRKLGERITWRARSAVVALLLILAVGHYVAHFHSLGQIHWPGYKLPAGALQDAQAVVSVAPEGVMLAPEDLYGIIPMLGPGHPQIRTRPDGQRLWIPESEDRRIRVNASRFVSRHRGVGGPRRREYNDFRLLLSRHPPDVIVLNATLLEAFETASAIIENGYTNQRNAGEYTVVWK